MKRKKIISLLGLALVLCTTFLVANAIKRASITPTKFATYESRTEYSTRKVYVRVYPICSKGDLRHYLSQDPGLTKAIAQSLPPYEGELGQAPRGYLGCIAEATTLIASITQGRTIMFYGYFRTTQFFPGTTSVDGSLDDGLDSKVIAVIIRTDSSFRVTSLESAMTSANEDGVADIIDAKLIPGWVTMRLTNLIFPTNFDAGIDTAAVAKSMCRTNRKWE